MYYRKDSHALTCTNCYQSLPTNTLHTLSAGAGPYDAFSLESQDSVQLATDTISKSQEIRRELRTVIGNKRLSQISAHNTVNEGLTRKLAETVTFTVCVLIHTLELTDVHVYTLTRTCMYIHTCTCIHVHIHMTLYMYT